MATTHNGPYRIETGWNATAETVHVTNDYTEAVAVCNETPFSRVRGDKTWHHSGNVDVNVILYRNEGPLEPNFDSEGPIGIAIREQEGRYL